MNKIEINPEPSKQGGPVYTHYFFSDSCTDDFLSAHTVDAQKPLPLSITTALGEISHTLFTFDPQDYITVPRFEFPAGYDGVGVRFCGNAFADIATGVFFENMMQIYHKIDADGKVHESSYMAPSWRYDGFGTWRPGAIPD
ncbi:MAG: hypothetical protein IKK58_01575 [Clostridia bacterium]|nr:hypothetical protein [Clostridia bacterium]